jgi:hypothetical protein
MRGAAAVHPAGLSATIRYKQTQIESLFDAPVAQLDRASAS